MGQKCVFERGKNSNQMLDEEEKRKIQKYKQTNRQTDKPTKVQYITQGWTL